MCAVYWSAPEAPVDTPILVLDGDDGGPVNNLAVMSRVAPDYAPAGRRTFVVTSVLGNPTCTDAEIERRIREHMRRWFGDAVEGWDGSKRTASLRAAEAGAACARRCRTPAPPRRRDVHGGRPPTDASIQGAFRLGRLAAEAVLSDLGVTS